MGFKDLCKFNEAMLDKFGDWYIMKIPFSTRFSKLNIFRMGLCLKLKHLLAHSPGKASYMLETLSSKVQNGEWETGPKSRFMTPTGCQETHKAKYSHLQPLPSEIPRSLP